ncbi:beta strand repeat-containing protein, partial [Euzebya tangerina]
MSTDPNSRTPLVRLATALAISLFCTALLLAGVAAPAGAQIDPDDFSVRFSADAQGDIAQIGNAVLTCPTSNTRCAPTQAGNDNETNNSFSMVNIDVDGDASTFNSSTADLDLPDDAEVLWAGLYWGAGYNEGQTTTTAPDPAARDTVRLRTPIAGYSTVTADELNTLPSGNNQGFQGFADITSVVQAAGDGTYGVANVQARTGQTGYGGWSIQIVYRDLTQPPRNLTIFDGLELVAATGGAVPVDVSGFQTPGRGPVRTRIGVLAWEGDDGLGGDSLALNTTTLTDAVNPSNNFFNSTISESGSHATAKNPNHVNQLAMDLDRVSADGVLANGATSATVTFDTNGDGYYPGVMTFATDLFQPNVDVQKVGTDLNGGDAEPGDIIEYSIEVSNFLPAPGEGIDDAREVVLTDPLPEFTTLVPGSITINNGVNAGAKTETVDADQAEVVDDVLTVRLGDGADDTDGGTIASDETTTVSFRVEIIDTVPNATNIDNRARVRYVGTTGTEIQDTSETVTTVVRRESDLSVIKTADPADVVTVGDTITWTIDVANAGPDDDPAVIVTDTLPAGVTVTNASPACSQIGSTVTCALGALAAGDSTSVTIAATVDGGTTGPLDNVATVEGDNEDPDPSDDSTGPVTVDLGQPPVATDDSATTATNTAVTTDVVANDTDPDGDDAALLLSAVSDPAGGTAGIVDGELVYTPDAGFAGTDTVTYTVTDEQGLTDTGTLTVTVDNAAPIARNDAGSVEEGETITLDLLVNDTDANGDGLTVTISNPPAGVTDNGDGTISYEPGLLGDADPDTVTVTFAYSVDDGNGGTDTATVALTVTQVPPVTSPDSVLTDHATPVTINVLANDAAPGNTGPLAVISVTVDPADGSATISGDQVIFTPADGVAGDVTFTYTVRDASGSTLTETVTVTVANAAPDATDDTAAVPFDTATPIDVLANDADANGDTLVVAGVTGVVGGSVAIGADGTPVFTPDTDFVGTGGFTYTVSDGNGGTDTAAVTVTVANADPIAVDDSASTAADTPVVVTVLDNDSDPNGTPLTVSIVEAPGGGSALVDGAGNVTVTPPSGFVGEYVVTYQVSDGDGGTDTATITVTVANATPDAQDDTAGVAAYGGAETPTTVTIDVVANDTDANGDTIVVTSVDTTSDSGGTIVDDGDGTVTYTPPADYVGTDSFTYGIADGRGGTASATVSVVVSADAPVARDDVFTLPNPAPGTLPAALTGAALLGNDISPNGLTLTVSAIGTATGGTAALNPDDTVDFTPDANFVGTATFGYTISDSAGGSDTATVRVIVPNAVPTAGADSASVAGGGQVDIPVLDNDADPNGDTLTITGLGGAAGTVGINPDGSIRYEAAAGFKGTDTFTYQVVDGDGGTASATVTVTVDNAAPVADDDSASTTNATAVDIDVLSNDTDPNGDALTVTAVDAPSNGTAVAGPAGVITYTPAGGFKGTDTFGYTLSDADSATDTAVVTVSVANAAPVAADDAATTPENTPTTIDLTVGDSDVNGDALTYSLGASPAGGSVSITPAGEATYTPLAGFSGTDTFTYRVSDGDGGISSATVTVTVTDVPPTAVDDTVTVTGVAAGQPNPPVSIPVLDNDLDPAGNGLSLESIDTDGTTGTADTSGDDISYTPAPGFKGTDTVSYRLIDGSGN